MAAQAVVWAATWPRDGRAPAGFNVCCHHLEIPSNGRTGTEVVSLLRQVPLHNLCETG